MATQLQLFNEVLHREPIDNRFMAELLAKKNPAGTCWCVIEKNLKRGDAIWGIGETLKEATEDAVKWLVSFADHHPEYDIKNEAELSGDTRFSILPCTSRVYRRVEKYGGEINFIINKGTVTLPTERSQN